MSTLLVPNPVRQASPVDLALWSWTELAALVASLLRWFGLLPPVHPDHLIGIPRYEREEFGADDLYADELATMRAGLSTDAAFGLLCGPWNGGAL
ncbi:MAG TPA: hypothetical protein VHX38_02330 [Pseudonocardiaceae bacterium]|jgi:hypothetical protein|nr:hypothetical protein [Pseudonocardiaceae bacterium]